MKQLITILSLAIIVASCNSKYDKTKTGLAYKIFKGSGGQKLKSGDIIKLNAKITIEGRDSVLYTTYGKLPEYFQYDSTMKNTHDFMEILPMCSEGDSIVTIAQVDTLVKRGTAQYNDILKRRDQIKTTLKIIRVFNSKEDQAKDQQQELDRLKVTQDAAFNKQVAALEKSGKKFEKSPGGVYVVVDNPGSSPKADTGKQVMVNYTGSLISNGDKFDSNIEPKFGHVQPLPLVIGSHSVIPGWEEGLKYFGVGGKGTLYIPYEMAYGANGRPPLILPYAGLKFDVEVKGITDAPKQQAQPQMDPRMLEQLQQQMQQQQQQQQSQQQPPQQHK